MGNIISGGLWEGESYTCTHPNYGVLNVPIPTKSQQIEIHQALGVPEGQAIVIVDTFCGWPILRINTFMHKHTIYYLNLETLKPTKKSPSQMELPQHIIDDLEQRKAEMKKEECLDSHKLLTL